MAVLVAMAGWRVKSMNEYAVTALVADFGIAHASHEEKPPSRGSTVRMVFFPAVAAKAFIAAHPGKAHTASPEVSLVTMSPYVGLEPLVCANTALTHDSTFAKSASSIFAGSTPTT